MHPMDRTWISIGLVVAIVTAFGLYHWVGNYAAGPFEREKLASRFPEKSLDYSLGDLQNLVANADLRKFYVVPLLFPLDLFVMLALAGSMGAAIWYWFGALGTGWALLALIPLIYLVSDLAEDGLLAWMLQPGNASQTTITALKTLTLIKLGSVIASAILTVVAFGLYLCRALSGHLS
jgi:hypothetical protein